jgi:putative tryptophan/tyrosine transport system substrate-binding protein
MRAGMLRWVAPVVFILGWGVGLAISPSAHSADTVAVLYPELPEPERGLFQLIREGAQKSIDAAGARTVELAVGETETKADLTQRVQEAGATRVLMLGRRAYETGTGLEKRYPSFVAAVDLPVGKSARVAGIAMYADPAVVFKTLHLLAPRIERVIIVLDQKSSGWIVDAAKAAAREERLDAVIYDAHSLAEGASHAWNVLQYGNPDTDALWVLNGSGYANEDVLPELVAESWRRHFLVFSNVVQHVHEGALFAVYLDPKALGLRAGTEVVHVAQGAHNIVFLQDLDRAVNTRVAAHLELPVSGALANTFDLVLGRQ